MTTTSEMSAGTGKLADRDLATTQQGAGWAVLGTVGYVVRQLAGALAIIVLVWLAVMLYRHVQPVALALAALVLVVGGAALFVRNRSLSRAG